MPDIDVTSLEANELKKLLVEGMNFLGLSERIAIVMKTFDNADKEELVAHIQSEMTEDEDAEEEGEEEEEE